MRLSSKVTHHYKKVTVLYYLTNRFTYRTEAQWKALIDEGNVYHKTAVCTPETLVTQGDEVVCVVKPIPPPPGVNFDYTIIYEDEWLVGINKPPSLRVHSSGKFVTGNLMYHLREKHEPQYPTVELINRLDTDTSGVVILAKDKETTKQMHALFRERQVDKAYIAIVNGVPNPESGQINEPIFVGKGRCYLQEGGKEALTSYAVQETIGDNYAVVALSPKTGRTHQLRVHMHGMGHRIVGDGLYAMDDKAFAEWQAVPGPWPKEAVFPRQALHSLRTSFPHPKTGELCVMEAPLATDMQRLLDELRAQQ